MTVVASAGPRQPAHHRRFDHRCDGPHRLEIAIRRDRKACLDYIDAHRVQPLGELNFFALRHSRARRLFAVAHGGVKDADMTGHDDPRIGAPSALVVMSG
jgi:hypothetical protein